MSLDLPRIISSCREVVGFAHDHNALAGKHGYDAGMGMFHLAGKAVKAGQALGNPGTDDLEAELFCNLLRGDISRLSAEPDNPFLLENVERAVASLERIWANRVREPEADSGEQNQSDELPDLVTGVQAASLVNRTIDGLKHYRKKGMPKPYIKGTKGRPNEYLWSEMRPWLEVTFSRKIPVDSILKFRSDPKK
jgi:hypothetical protein